MFDLTILHAAVPPAMQHVAGRSAAGEFICRPAPVSNSDTAASGLPPAKRHLHCAIVLVVCLLANLTTDAATYYVSPAGSDANPGTEAGPFATVHKAAAVAVAGDTVIIQPAIYTGAKLNFTNSGTPSAPISFLGNGNATHAFDFDVNAGRSNIVFSGLSWSGYQTAALWLRRGTRNITITNCVIRDSQFVSTSAGIFMDGPLSDNKVPEVCSSYNTIISNRFSGLTNVTALNIQGVGHFVHGNTWQNLYASDAMRIFGSNTVIRANLFTNISGLAGYGNHPDIMQTFGHLGMWMVDFVFEQNRVVNAQVQLMQMQQDIVLGTNLWGITLRNNVFEDSNMQCSISIPNVKFHNNTFYRCSNGASLMGFNWYDPSESSTWRGAAYGGQVLNNAFVECSGFYTATSAGPAQGSLTTQNAGGGGRTGNGYARVRVSGGVITVSGTYSGLSGIITGGVLYHVGGADLYPVSVTNFSNGTLTANLTMVDGQGGYTLAQQSGVVNARALGFRIITSAFPSGEISGALPAYQPNPPADLLANHNFVSGSNGSNLKNFAEPNGLNGGNPLFVNAANSDFRLREGSPLIGKGMPLNNLFTTDMLGVTRGAKWDIGAFQFEAGQAILRPSAPSGFRLVLQ